MKIKRKEGLTEIKFEHNRVLFWTIIILLAILIGILIYIIMHPNSNENGGIANPASVYCEENDGKLSIVTDSDGSQRGVCTLKNGTECDEWKYYSGEC